MMKARLLSVGATLASTLAPALARAEEFEKFTGKPAEQIAATPFIAGAYGFIWAAVLIYVVFVARGLGRTRREVDELRRKVNRGA